MSISNPTRVTSLTTEYLNLPAIAGISDHGYWYYYTPANANNTSLLSSITPYQWANALPLTTGSNLVIDGTMPLITENWANANLKYHGGCIEWIGAGINNVTDVQETDAFFFAHLGATTTSPSDNVFYWDRAFEPITANTWSYYLYHKHSPTNYVSYENGRQVLSADGFLDPADKVFGYQISTIVRVTGTDYASVMARVQTPSVGGAHNSHNDITLPTVANKNYMPAGIIKGVGERFHAFYITQSGSDWEIFNRTYLDASSSFTSQVSLGVFDLADPSFNPGANLQSLYPVRASCGDSFIAKIYIPVILNNNVSGFDLEIWSFNSLDTISAGTLTRQVLASGVSTRPDCHCLAYGTTALYALFTDSANGGCRLWKYDGSSWSDVGAFLTNDASKPLRVHGFKFNSTDFKFYALLSGTAQGGGTYLGPGMYTFELTGTFSGYPHLSYDYTNNSFIERGALETGYLKYTPSTATFTQVSSTEPQAIPSDTQILNFDMPANQFFNRKSIGFGGKDYYYQAITLKDGRRMAVGQVNDPTLSSDNSGDILISLYSPDLSSNQNFSIPGTGDDLLTGVFQSQVDNKVWLTGYAKSELVPKGNIWIHGWCRNLSDGANTIQWVDVTRDQSGNFYTVGAHSSGWTVLAKYNTDYELVWQKNLGTSPGFTDVATGITLDTSGNIYISGRTQETGFGSNDALVVKLNSSGAVIWSRAYGTAGSQGANSIALVPNNTADYLVLPVISSNATTFLSIDTNGAIVSQNLVNDIVVNRVRPDLNSPATGRFLFAGYNYTSSDWAGQTYTITNQGTNNYVWNGGVYTNTTDPSPVTLYRGSTYTFNLNASGHPFWIKTAQVTGNGSAYSTGVTNNGTDVGTITFTVPSDAPSTLYYICQLHSGMSGAFSVQDNPTIGKYGMSQITGGTKLVQWLNTYSLDSVTKTNDILNVTTAISGNGAGYVICGSSNTSAVMLKVSVNEISGNYTISKNWDKTVANSALNSLLYREVEGVKYAWAVGTTNYSNIAYMGMYEGLITNWSANTGNIVYQNVFGHDMDEQWLSVVDDLSGHNIVTVGWSESHSSSRDGVLFRSSRNGFGTGTYNLTGVGTSPYYYLQSNLTIANASGTVSNLSTPNNSLQNMGSSLYSPTVADSNYTSRNFDGASGLYNMVVGYLDMELLQQWFNTSEYKDAVSRGDRVIYFSNFEDVGKLYQIGTVGDATVDDGSIFGYDIIEHSNGKSYAIGQTSGDIDRRNIGSSGVYDYLLVEIDIDNDELSFYQNGTERDEEAYSLTELSNGNIAYVGRTTGNIASPNYGGYDIFLGIFNPNTDISSYYSIGSGLDDAALNVHDLGNNELAVVYYTFGTLGNTTNAGSQDIGIIKFNYNTNTWGNAYQTGSSTSELYLQNGKTSTKISNNRIAVAASSTGVFADDAVTFGFLDLCLAILNFDTETWDKFQIGTTANEIASSVSNSGDILLIAGYSSGSFSDDLDAIFVEFNAAEGIVGRTSTVT